ncbi:cytochrome b5 isoform X2 [Anastrepha ludens]|uniref:cytochrome b5 isoform X2 n=1 Tax=Anastrepha ludens TaxID=28586 RepID=UPI0023AF73AC|nr:cytochrome b5 isoform X2 [Anastrepha ludens]XP_053952556.1 cytochrome b5 isoform X2 [Anastrepha ludens]
MIAFMRSSFTHHLSESTLPSMILKHPGGEDSILEYAGKDATKAFNEVGHSTDAVKEMKSYKIGTIRAESTQILDTQPTSAANGPSEKQPAENYSQTQNKRKNFFFCC